MRLFSVYFFGILLLFGQMSASLAASSTARAQKGKVAEDIDLSALRALLRTPENQLDLAKAKLTIDRMIDPRIDAASTLLQLDAMAEQVKLNLPPNATRQVKFVALMSYLHKPSPWNGQRAFSYDLDDPFGKNIRNKLLTTYLATRKGNCVSMPVLFVILAQKIGLDATLSTAPTHVFSKFRGDDGRMVNVENTSVGTKSDSSYQKDFHITPKAMASGIYLQQLSKRESVVVMLSTLMEFYGQQNQQMRRIAVADIALKAYPKDVAAMLQKGNAYYRLLKQQYLDKYPTLEQIPSGKRLDFEKLSRNNDLWFDKAESLGWRMPTQAQDAAYEKSIQRTKALKRGGS